MKRIVRQLEPVECMATVGDNSRPTFSVSVNPDPKRIGICYFKVFNSLDYTSSELLARVNMREPSYVYHTGDGKKAWNLNSKYRRELVRFMRSESDTYNGTNWQATMFLWNRELHLFSGVENKSGHKLFDAYVRGYFDKFLSDNPSYMPSYAEMPNYLELK